MGVAAAVRSWPPHVNGRTLQKVRRGSVPYEAGDAFFRPLQKITVVHIMRGAERLALESMRRRQKKVLKLRHAGELTLSDLSVLQVLLFQFMDWKSGRCAPTYDDIQEKTGHARDTIVAAFRRLAKVGILERLRRFRVAPAADGKGPQVHQAPNAYRFALPRRLRALLGLLDREEALSADAAHDARNARRSNAEMEADEAEQTGKSNLAFQLRRLEAALSRRAPDQRESSE